MHTNIGCFIGSTVSIMSCIYLPNLLVNFENIIMPAYVFVYIFSLYAIWVYVPADVPEIPVINEQRRKRDKILSLVVVNILFAISLFIIKNEVYAARIIITIFSIDIMTTRTIYKLFKNEYGYETYVPDELLMTE